MSASPRAHFSEDLDSIDVQHPIGSELDTGSADESSDSESELDTQSMSEAQQTNDYSNESSVINSGDFGKVVCSCRKLTDNEKYTLMKHHFIPGQNYKFPPRSFGGHPRSFQINWLSQFNGLVYSESQNGGYCKFCVLFGKCGPTVKNLGVLVNSPLIDFKRAKEKLNLHFHSSKGKKFHQAAVEAAHTFMSVRDNPELAIDHRLNSERSQLSIKNRLILKSIAETVIFLGRQGLSFRGHRDDSPALAENPCSNHGNFLALLQFRVQSGDCVLEEHLKTAAKNAIYTSKTTQNEFISICGNLIQRKILKKIQEVGFFSVIADEATDIANEEQLSISIRFLDGETPSERFLAFSGCLSGVSGEDIARDILAKLVEWQLQPHLLRGQAYDGAGAMAGKSKGAAARIMVQHPKAVYTHCAAHRLNLCIMKCCSVREITNMMQTADAISRFFSFSPKRQLSLEKWIDSTMPSEEKRRKLKELCRTRWVERHEAFEVLMDLFVPVFSCLEAIVYGIPAEWNIDTRSKAQSFLLSMSQFSFVAALVLSQKILSYTKGLSVKLQGRLKDVICAHQDIKDVISVIKQVRSRVDNFHSQIYEQVTEIGQLVDVMESKPRQAIRQQHRLNTPSDSISEYYKLNYTIPILDHLINELDTRFDENSSDTFIEFQQLLPSEVVNKTSLSPNDFTNSSAFYKDDFPSISSFEAELDLWHCKWRREHELALKTDTLGKTLPHADSDYFPNIRTMLVIAITLPVTSCECERSISALRFLKSPLRNTMSQERLNGLAMLQYHKDIVITPEEVVEEFARVQPRRLYMANPFRD